MLLLGLPKEIWNHILDLIDDPESFEMLKDVCQLFKQYYHENKDNIIQVYLDTCQMSFRIAGDYRGSIGLENVYINYLMNETRFEFRFSNTPPYGFKKLHIYACHNDGKYILLDENKIFIYSFNTLDDLTDHLRTRYYGIFSLSQIIRTEFEKWFLGYVEKFAEKSRKLIRIE